jgi:hypothetical protein
MTTNQQWPPLLTTDHPETGQAILHHSLMTDPVKLPSLSMSPFTGPGINPSSNFDFTLFLSLDKHRVSLLCCSLLPTWLHKDRDVDILTKHSRDTEGNGDCPAKASIFSIAASPGITVGVKNLISDLNFNTSQM